MTRKVAEDDGGSVASHNGTAAGRVIELWHRLGARSDVYEEALAQTVAENHPRHALANWDTVRHWTLHYAQDPRNRAPDCYAHFGEVVADLQEAEVKVTLDPDPDDPRQEPIELVGHVDQIRRDEHGHLRVWDVKTSKGKGSGTVERGESTTRAYALQLAAYALACTETLGEDVLPGGIVFLRGYDSKGRGGGYAPDEFPVFYPVAADLEACRALLGTVAYTVGELNRGIVRMQPGDACRYCPGGGWGECYRLVEEAIQRGALL